MHIFIYICIYMYTYIHIYTSKHGAASGLSRKARKKLAQKERDLPVQEIALREKEACKTAEAIAQAAAALLRKCTIYVYMYTCIYMYM